MRGEARSPGEQEAGAVVLQLRGGREEAQRLGEGQPQDQGPQEEGEEHSGSAA